jgi:tRNA-dihydrouridine synthase
LGYNENIIGTWLRRLLSAEPVAVTVHGRTRQEKSKVPANWQAIGEAVKIRDEVQGSRFGNEKTLIIGNGDVQSRQEGLDRIAETKVDGIMVGRGAFGNPWFFRADNYQPDTKEHLNVMLEHAELFQKELGEFKSFMLMRKHFKAYSSGFDGAHELRAKLMVAKDLEETKKIVEEFLDK